MLQKQAVYCGHGAAGERETNKAMNGNLQAQKLGLNLSDSKGAEHIVFFQL